MRTIEQIKESIFTEWRDGQGEIQINSKTNGTGLPDNENASAFDGYVYFFLYKLGILDSNDKDRVLKHIQAHQTKDVDGNPIPGLFNRHPRSFEDVKKDKVASHDEYTGIVAMAFVTGLVRYIREILDYGYKNGFIYNNHDLGGGDIPTQIRYTRQGVNIAFFQALGGDGPTIWDWLWFYISTMVTAFKPLEDTDGKMMALVKLDLVAEKYAGVRLFFLIWKQIIKYRYRNFKVNDKSYGPIESIFRWYFKKQDYPISELAGMYDAKFM